MDANKNEKNKTTTTYFCMYIVGTVFSQGYCRFRLFWKYAEIGYFGRLKLFPFQGLTSVHFSIFSENNGFLNIYMFK